MVSLYQKVHNIGAQRKSSFMTIRQLCTVGLRVSKRIVLEPYLGSIATNVGCWAIKRDPTTTRIVLAIIFARDALCSSLKDTI